MLLMFRTRNQARQFATFRKSEGFPAVVLEKKTNAGKWAVNVKTNSTKQA